MKLKHGGGIAIDGQDVQLPLLQGGSCFLLQAGLAQLPQHLPLSCAHCFPFCRNVGECYLWRAGWVSSASIPVRMEGFLEEEDKWRKMAGRWRRGGCSRSGRECRGKAGPRGFSTQLEPKRTIEGWVSCFWFYFEVEKNQSLSPRGWRNGW